MALMSALISWVRINKVRQEDRTRKKITIKRLCGLQCGAFVVD